MTDPLPVEQRRETLETIAREVQACRQCVLHSARTQAVPGTGRPDAEIMFIGEAPGYHEDQQGLPFVGASGKYLGELLGMIGLTRNDVFITNVIKCRPPGNRDPLPAEIDTCVPAFLQRQIATVQPKIIATLGRYSMALFLPNNVRITKVHGQPRHVNGRVIYPLFHPAAVLRNPNLRPAMEADFRRMYTLLEELRRSTPGEEPPPPPRQLSLF